MSKYVHVFFDLDRTLWDFDSNSATTLIELIDHFKLNKFIPNTEEWLQIYKRHNFKVWELYEERKINKSNLRVERFRLLLKDFNIRDNKLSEAISEYYMAYAPRKKQLMPGAKDVLNYLKPKYKIHIVSNGFYSAQNRKLKASKIDGYFSSVLTSDNVNVAKPQQEIFEEAVKRVNARKRQSVFIGDSLKNDVIGPQNFGMDQIWYNHDNVVADVQPTYEITSLVELKDIL